MTPVFLKLRLLQIIYRYTSSAVSMQGHANSYHPYLHTIAIEYQKATIGHLQISIASRKP